jgi:ABC-type transport system involved in multi-copper enzyme maturation permease subunit
MPAALVIARLTLREARRRRLLLILLVLTLVMVAVTGWGFSKLWDVRVNGRPPGTIFVRTTASQLMIVVAFMFTTVLGLSATVVASPSISGDLETGLALSMLARPIRRADMLLGKWLGFVAMVVFYTGGAAALEMVVVNWVTGYMPPHPAEFVLFVSAVGIALVTLSMALSTRLSGLVGGVIALVGFFMSWMGGIVGSIGQALGNQPLIDAGTISRLIVPADGLWRGAIWALEPAIVIAGVRSAGPGAASNPFFAADPPPVTYLAWCAVWILGLLGLAVWSFSKREV